MVRASLFLTFFVLLTSLANADNLYLKNGRNLEGLIMSEDKDSIELEVCSGGSIKLLKSEVQRIERSLPEDELSLRLKWEKQKLNIQKRILQQQIEEEGKPKNVQFFDDSRGIVLPVTINKKLNVSLVLDTGASVIVLRKNIADKLGIKLDKAVPDVRLTLADGRKIDAKFVLLDNVKVEKVEARNVEAAIMLEEVGDILLGDGLLGMSFLKMFNFKVDHKNNKLTLEKF